MNKQTRIPMDQLYHRSTLLGGRTPLPHLLAQIRAADTHITKTPRNSENHPDTHGYP